MEYPNKVGFVNWKSQNVISNKEKMGLRKPPNVFTEQGVAMLSSVLNSENSSKMQNLLVFANFTDLMAYDKKGANGVLNVLHTMDLKSSKQVTPI